VLVTGTGLFNLTGSDADNRLTGNASNNTLDGGAGDDTLDGGAGNDMLIGGTGADTLSGGAGNDTYTVDDAGDVVNEALAGSGGGTDTVIASVSYALAANVEALTLAAGAGAIAGTGNALANSLTGNEDANVLDGGLGNDTLTGGAGADDFVFSTAASATNRDVVTDFAAGTDRLVFDNAAFTGLTDGILDASVFRSGAGLTTAGDADDRFIFNTTTGALYYDADGAGGAAAIQVGTLQGAGATTLAATDFLVT